VILPDRRLSSSPCLDSFARSEPNARTRAARYSTFMNQDINISGRSDCSQHAIATRKRGAKARWEASPKIRPAFSPLFVTPHSHIATHTIPHPPSNQPRPQFRKSYQMFSMQPYSREGWLAEYGKNVLFQETTLPRQTHHLTPTFSAVTIPMSRWRTHGTSPCRPRIPQPSPSPIFNIAKSQCQSQSET
jgi:hypothetical protein